MESQILKNNLKDQLHKAKVWATGDDNFVPIVWLLFLIYVVSCASYALMEVMALKYNEDKITAIRICLGILFAAISLIGQDTVLLLGLPKKKPRIFVMINHITIVLFSIAVHIILTGLTGLPLPERTRFQQDFCTKGNFLPHTVKELIY